MKFTRIIEDVTESFEGDSVEEIMDLLDAIEAYEIRRGLGDPDDTEEDMKNDKDVIMPGDRVKIDFGLGMTPAKVLAMYNGFAYVLSDISNSVYIFNPDKLEKIIE